MQPDEDGGEITKQLVAAGTDDLGLEARGMRGELERKLFGAPLEPPRIGRYLVLERVGEGGLGVVYEAYDPELDRRVALKVMRPDPELRDHSARLVREARALARLDHANVVAVYDVGEEGGNVFIAMELVRGDELGAWLTKRARSWREVLRVFTEAGRGLGAAHAKHIIHRDFKPSNVLVGRDGRARVVDFGLARVTGTPVSDESQAPALPKAAQSKATDLTQARTVLGTPAYMAPEQHRGETADERSDIYAFCSALYEALAGEPPFRGDTLQELAQSKERALDLRLPGAPRWLARTVAKGLAPDRDLRYRSMGELLRDLEAAKRRRAVLVGATVVGTVATLLVAGDLVRGHRAQSACDRMQREVSTVWNDDTRAAVRHSFEATGRDRAAEAAGFVVGALDRYSEDWSALALARCEETLVARERPQADLEQVHACLEHRLEALEVLSDVLRGVQADALGRTAEAVDALPPIAECNHPGGASPAAGPAHEDQRRLLRAATLRMAARRDEAAVAAQEVLEAADAADDLGLQAQAQVELGWIDFERGRMTSAQRHIRAALTAAEHAGDDAARARGWVLNGVIAQMQGRPDEAELSVDMADAVLARHPEFLRLRISSERLRGILLTDRRELDSAMEAYERASAQIRELFGDEHPMVARSLMDRAVVLQLEGKLDEAKDVYLRALDMYERTVGSYVPQVPRLLANLGALAQSQNDHEAAQTYLMRSIEIVEAQFGTDHLHTAPARHNLALVLSDLGRHEDAVQQLEHSIAIRERAAGPRHREIAGSLVALARARSAQRRPEQAVALLERVLAFPDDAGVSLENKASAWFDLAKLVWTEQPDRARELATKALEVRTAEDPDGSLAREISAWLSEHRG
jgi:serine/threonine-protein kinase